ncbi:hypothetical protein BS47DRAFT_404397 [Hydnum rufescens UP504]|uniref:Uncharacterized protein n=2 Tax=Hydnum rufescens UP504 TaxID=1448309 RepID=A0A9P6BDE7_9AGAM|nr:hypothetical protein BS47DRAFT_404397 [Hydnum rufescens UP504]
MKWHHYLGPRPTKINMFQFRRERSNARKHQRSDKRGSKSIDTIADVKSLSDLDKTSDFLAELHCQGSDVDLLNIIKICFGIHRDNKAGRYMLQRFNCYFFAWTMLVATMRHAVQWDILPFDSPWETLSQTLADALSKFAGAMMNMIIDGIVIVVMTLRIKLKPQLSRVMSRRARLAWVMPEWLINLALRPILRRSAHRPIPQSVLTDLRASTLRTTLWKDDVGDAMRDAARRDTMASIINTGCTTLSRIRLTMEDVDVFRFLTGNVGDRDFFGGRRGDWRLAIIAGFGGVMQTAPRFAVDGADRFLTDDTK